MVGKNIPPYWALVRSYSDGLVKIELAAGKVTRVMPWTNPAALTTAFSARLDWTGATKPIQTSADVKPLTAASTSPIFHPNIAIVAAGRDVPW